MEAVAIYLGYLVRKTQTISCFGIENVVFLIYSKRPDFVENVISKKVIFGSLKIQFFRWSFLDDAEMFNQGHGGVLQYGPV